MASSAAPSQEAAKSPAATTAATTAHDAGFEEDDEFEEFEDEDWPDNNTNNNNNNAPSKETEWADDWDDDLVEGDFVNQLRQELANKAKSTKDSIPPYFWKRLDYKMLFPSKPSPAPRVVILGLGYAGALLAVALEPAARSHQIELVVIDRRQAIHHKIGSIRASVLGGEWTARTQIPVDHIQSFATHIVANVHRVDGATNQIYCTREEEGKPSKVSFDVLVVATGTHGHSVGGNVFSPREIEDYFAGLAGAIGRARDVLIVGGGPSAIEFAGEIRHQYPSKPVRIVCSSKQLLSSSIAPLPKSFHRALLRRLKEINVQVLLEEKVEVPANLIHLAQHRFAERATVQCKGRSSREMHTDLLLWTVSSLGSVTKEGSFPSTWLNEIGELNITSTFQLSARPDVFAVGDVCSLAETKQAVTLPGKMKLISHNILCVARAMQRGEAFTHQDEIARLRHYQVCLRPTMYIPIGPELGVSSYRGFTFGSRATAKWKGRHLFTEMFWDKLTQGKASPPSSVLNHYASASLTTL
ncbi:hypothetical protein BASA81_001511 [Batrachochytrium salamandrivorans]|nr:hypothetical protein BASA81_001511 [Batrachochytrium salamandrivorans]